jgi:hypothetical protein
MGDDPAQSVTNAEGQFHYVTNLHAGDASVLPTCGSANPVEQAIIARGAPVTVVNSGTISGTVGVLLSDGGSVTNNAGGSIKGADTGIAANQAATVMNFGTISGGLLGVGLSMGDQ